MTKLRPLLLAFVAVLGASACAHQARKTASTASTTAPAADGGVSAARASEPDVRDRVTERISEVKDVHFDYDSDILGETARATLAKNAEWLKAHGDVNVVQIAGHCDPRGTVEYNLALGQRRAKAVRDYYVSMGVAASRLATISYGKEQPACSQATEECYRRDRRAETLKAVTAVASDGAAGSAVH